MTDPSEAAIVIPLIFVLGLLFVFAPRRWW